MIGSTRMARRAGSQQAMRATTDDPGRTIRDRTIREDAGHPWHNPTMPTCLRIPYTRKLLLLCRYSYEST